MEKNKKVFGACVHGVSGIVKALLIILILSGGAGPTDGHPTLQCERVKDVVWA